ncbi:MAG: acetate--CoA ligase family protein [Deltaproteobacteria bacterium]|nr:acetate--CoA ligase family protein [Deltaproteobacteria bacterium]
MDQVGDRRPLSEAASKRLLASFGIPVVEEAVAADAEEAASLAERFGYPVVLKALGARLAHKTERGLVKLALADAGAVARAAVEIRERAGDDLEGFLVQPLLTGRREFVAGLFRDPVFGPVVMFGLGGVFTEALADTTFRLAPLSRADADEMLDGARCAPLLGAFRGEAPADRDALAAALLGLSRLALERPDVAEVDVNPLLVDSEGRVAAVDALVVLREPSEPGAGRPRIAPEEVRALFCPRSVAFIGASAGLGKWGQVLPANLLAGGFPGPVYLVNAKGGILFGRPVYRSVADVPGPVDLAVITVPAEKVLALFPDLRGKGVRHAVVITSGFGETGPEGREREASLLAAARESGVVLLGPNTMGLCNPPAGVFLTGVHVRPRPGTTALVSQSGNLGVQLLTFAERQGLGIRAFAGSGNEAMVSVEDLLEALGEDDLTRTVVLYVESIKDGPRFFELARHVGRRKPVVVLKGGRTGAGAAAAASHTGAMASDLHVFEGACRQAGVILVEQPTDLLDASAAFSSVPLPEGRRVAILTLGGGWGVVASDLCAEHGLTVPELSAEVVRRLDRLLPSYWSLANPVDLVGENDPDLPIAALEELARWEGCDAVLNLGIQGRTGWLDTLLAATAAVDAAFRAEGSAAERLAAAEILEARYVAHTARLMDRYGKPILGVGMASGPPQPTLRDVEGSAHKGVFFDSPERAVKALARLCDYRQFLSRGP